MGVSLLYRIAKRAVGFTGNKKIFSLGPDELRAFLKKAEPKRKTRPPAYIGKKHLLRVETFAHGETARDCYIISPRGKKASGNKASSGSDASSNNKFVLFLHGGGFVLEAHWVHWRAVSKIVERLGTTVWFPVYPLIPPVQDLKEATEFVIAVYTKMRETYPAGEISFLGDSAGAALSLMICHHCKKLNTGGLQRLPMPEKLILLSPAMLTEQNTALLEEMRRIESRDVMLSMQFMFSLISLLNLDLSPENYFNAPLYGDFSGFPALYVFSGTSEIFYPQMQPFIERAKAAGVPVEFYPGEEMMHIWAYIPLARECVAALEQIMGILGGKIPK
jgi:acetyl esterase/lipase